MLRPTKHSHPDRTVISVSANLIGYLKKRRLVGYEELYSYVKKSVSGGGFLFVPALNVLFLLGLIEYHPKNDSIEFVGDNEII